MNTKLAALMDELRLVQADLEVEEDSSSQAIAAFARSAGLGTRWKAELHTKGATVQTAVVRPYMPGQAQSVAFLFDGKVFKAFTNMPVWSILLVPNSRIYTAYRQVGKATFEIYGKDGNLLHTWTKLSGTLGTVQDRQAFLKDLTQIRRWKVQIDGAQPYTQIVEGAWESELDGITVDYGGRESFTYDNQAIVKKGKGYQIWWEMTGPREIWVPITK